MVPKRQAINRFEPDEIGQVGVMEDIGVHPASVRFAAADIKIPLSLPQDAFLEETVTQEIERLGEDDQSQYEKNSFHERRHCRVDQNFTSPRPRAFRAADGILFSLLRVCAKE